MAKVRRASPKSSPPPPPQHRAKWRPNAKRSLAHFARPLTSLVTLHPGPIVLHSERQWQYPTKQGRSPSFPPNPSLTPPRSHATTFRRPPTPPSAVGDFGSQIVFVSRILLLLPPSPFNPPPPPTRPPLPRRLYLLRPNPALATSSYYLERRLSVSAARSHQRPEGSASVHKCACVCV